MMSLLRLMQLWFGNLKIRYVFITLHTGYQTSYDEFSFNDSFFGVNWNRVVLDAAHVTRIYRCKTSEASTFAFPRIIVPLGDVQY